MKKKVQLFVNELEHDIIVQSLLSWKNDLQAQGRYTDAIDDLLLKVLKAPKRHI